MKLKYRKTKGIIKAVENRHIMYNETTDYIKEKEKNGEIFVIRPPKALNIKSVCHEKEELLRVYHMGRKEAEKILENLKEYLSK